MTNLLKTLLMVLALGSMPQVQAQTVGSRPEAIAPDRIDQLLDTAKTCLGIPYRHGGTSPKGFDCSGFVRFVFDSVGIELNRSSRTQAKEGTPVALDALLPGDLLFFKTCGQKHAISHVGIYLGQGEFIHAGSWGGPRNRCIRLAQLASKYFSDRLVGARRVVDPEDTNLEAR